MLLNKLIKGASINSELPDSLVIFSPSKAEELKRSLKLREATTTQSRRKKGSEDGDEWVFSGAFKSDYEGFIIGRL